MRKSEGEVWLIGGIDEKRIGLNQVVESSECQVKTPEFNSIDQEETLKISEQSNADLVEMDKMVVMGHIMGSWLRWVITEMEKSKQKNSLRKEGLIDYGYYLDRSLEEMG